MFSGDDLIPRLGALFHAMDAAYSEAAARVGFSCTGCDGAKCCTVDLMVHTFLEMRLLRRGFKTLDSDAKAEVLRRCRSVVRARGEDPTGDAYRNSICVLNFAGSCGLYLYRPMICRLAGIPHIIIGTDGRTSTGEGCETFRQEIQPANPELKLDRTDFYRTMASIETEAVRSAGARTVPLTVAEILFRHGDST